MLLAIDIGNSTAKLGVFDHENLIARQRILTIRQTSADEIAASLENKINYDFTGVIISSVVTEANEPFRAFCQKHLDLEPLFVDHTFDFGFRIKYDPPSSAGADRLTAAFAASEKYGRPVIACDFGTATTIDVVSAENEYAGGVITPGINTLSEALFLKTSKLPRVEIRKPASVIGGDTVSAIQSGIFFGYTGLTEGILRRMFEELGERPKVVATGGFARLIAENCGLIDTVDENLMLDGLRLLYEKNRDQVVGS
jgi:type III pantothenate kinase